MLRPRNSFENWILSQNMIKPGDIIAFFSYELGEEIEAKVTGFPSQENSQYVSFQALNKDFEGVVNFYSTKVYKIGSASIESKCTCGAKHTSNPNHHLHYCELHGKVQKE